jgi:hypothetical protein
MKVRSLIPQGEFKRGVAPLSIISPFPLRGRGIKGDRVIPKSKGVR